MDDTFGPCPALALAQFGPLWKDLDLQQLARRHDQGPRPLPCPIASDQSSSAVQPWRLLGHGQRRHAAAMFAVTEAEAAAPHPLIRLPASADKSSLQP